MHDWIMVTTLHLLSLVLPISQWAALFTAFILLPLAMFQQTRTLAGWLLYGVFLLLSLATWLLGAAIAFVSYGWLGLIIGLIVLGVGVVPIGMVGAYFVLAQPEISITITVMLALTLVAGILSSYLIAKGRGVRDK